MNVGRWEDEQTVICQSQNRKRIFNGDELEDCISLRLSPDGYWLLSIGVIDTDTCSVCSKPDTTTSVEDGGYHVLLQWTVNVLKEGDGERKERETGEERNEGCDSWKVEKWLIEHAMEYNLKKNHSNKFTYTFFN